MSFTSDVKHELASCDVAENLRETLRFGMVFGFKGDGPYFITKEKTAAGYVRKYFPKNSVSIRTAASSNGISYCVTFNDRLLPLKYGYKENRILSSSIRGSDEQVGVFLRGLFMVCGNVYVQKAGYHLEFSVGSKEKCEELYRLTNEQGMTTNLSHRGQSYFLYSKNSENISGILTFMGSVQSSMEIMNIKILKEVRSNINRSVNCETANIDRTARASAKQLDDIRLILDTLPDDKLANELKEIAQLRIENPDMSLRDLGKLLDPPISRSGVNHRFERLAVLAENIRNGTCS